MKHTQTLLGLAVIVCVVYLVWNNMGAKDTEAGKFIGRAVLNPMSLVEGALAERRSELRPTNPTASWGFGEFDPSTGKGLLPN